MDFWLQYHSGLLFITRVSRCAALVRSRSFVLQVGGEKFKIVATRFSLLEIVPALSMSATVPPNVAAKGVLPHLAATPAIKFRSSPGLSPADSGAHEGGSAPSMQSLHDVVMHSDEESVSEKLESESTSSAPTKERNKANVGARTSRASAVAALAAQAEADPSLTNPEKPRRNPTRQAGPPLAPRLDFSSLRTSAPSTLPSKTPENRMFNLEHSPVYYPTVEEFASPLQYIEMISVEAKEYGICKVVPPPGWRPPFALNTEVSSLSSRRCSLADVLDCRHSDSRLDCKSSTRWKPPPARASTSSSSCTSSIVNTEIAESRSLRLLESLSISGDCERRSTTLVDTPR